MGLQYNQVNLSINGQNILADSIDLNQSSPQKPIYSLNNNIPFDNIPTNIKNSISINYFMEPGNEPNFKVLTGTINDTSSSQASIINIGNIYITGYINNYSFQLSPNGLIKVSSTFEVYYPFTGNLIPQLSNDSNLYDLNNSSGIAHYWAAQFLSGNNVISNNNILQMNYSANLNLNPIYSIGDFLPKQIYVNNIEESINILSEQQYNVTFSGKTFDSLIPNLQNLKLKNISTVWNNNLSTSIIFPLTGMILQEVKSNISNDNLVFFSISFNRYH